MLSKETKNGSFFCNDKKITQDSDFLNQCIRLPKPGIYPPIEPDYFSIRNYSPLLKILSKKCLLAEKVLDEYCTKHDVNFSDEDGLTLLHYLIIIERFDLATSVTNAPEFTKINYKADLCFIDWRIQATALNFSIYRWLENQKQKIIEKDLSLEFIHRLLKFGARPPSLETKFMFDSFIEDINSYIFYSTVAINEMADLLHLLSLYGMPIDDVRERLLLHAENFNPTTIKGSAVLRTSKYPWVVSEITVEQYKNLKSNIQMLMDAINSKNEIKQIKSYYLVELTEERKREYQFTNSYGSLSYF